MKKFLLLPTIREKIATAFKKADEGSLSDFYKSLESIEFTGELEKDYNNIEDTIKTILAKQGLTKVLEEFIKIAIDKKQERDTKILV